MSSDPLVGKRAVVNRFGDLYMEADTRKFIGEICTVEQLTKGGKYLVVHPDGSKAVIRKRNLDIVEEGN